MGGPDVWYSGFISSHSSVGQEVKEAVKLIMAEKTPCQHCKGSYANLEGHMKNVHPDKVGATSTPTPPTPPQETPPAGEFVTKKQLDEAMGGILEAIKNITPAAPTSEQGRVFRITKDQEPERKTTVAEAGPQDPRSTLTPEQQGIFEEYFDPADGFTASFKYPYFSIHVPDKFSNADAAWKKYYAAQGDVRVKFIRYDNLEGGMRDWCKLVAANLKYNKNIRTK